MTPMIQVINLAIFKLLNDEQYKNEHNFVVVVLIKMMLITTLNGMVLLKIHIINIVH